MSYERTLSAGSRGNIRSLRTWLSSFLAGIVLRRTTRRSMKVSAIVERQLGEKSVRAGEQELFKSRAKERGQVKIIDVITARLDAKTDSYVATLPSVLLNNVRISPVLVNANERMLTGGFYAEIELAYDPTIAEEQDGRPFGIASLREIQLSKRDVLPAMYRGREMFSFDEVEEISIRSTGHGSGEVEPAHVRHSPAAHGSIC